LGITTVEFFIKQSQPLPGRYDPTKIIASCPKSDAKLLAEIGVSILIQTI
jgi:hypothetical protein